MKTKHLYISVMLATFFLASNTTTQAQTKEETIAWIKDKFIKYADHMGPGWSANVVSLDINPCEIIFVYKSIHTDGSGYLLKRTFPVLPNTTVIVEGGDIPRIRIRPDNETSLVHFVNDVSESGQGIWEGYKSDLVLRNGEPDLAERMQKALRHLATFCEKKKETF